MTIRIIVGVFLAICFGMIIGEIAAETLAEKPEGDRIVAITRDIAQGM